jgi:hypothetical protein
VIAIEADAFIDKLANRHVYKVLGVTLRPMPHLGPTVEVVAIAGSRPPLRMSPFNFRQKLLNLLSKRNATSLNALQTPVSRMIEKRLPFGVVIEGIVREQGTRWPDREPRLDSLPSISVKVRRPFRYQPRDFALCVAEPEGSIIKRENALGHLRHMEAVWLAEGVKRKPLE